MLAQDRLARLRGLRDLHKPLLARGVPLRGSEELAQSMTLLFRDTLTNLKDKRRVPRAAELAHRLYDQGERAAAPVRPVACRAGCDSCCHAFVSVLAPEAFLLAEELVARKASAGIDPITAFKLNAGPLAGKDQAARLSSLRMACPLLVDRLCGVHLLRPLACRKHTSFAVEACIAAYEGRDVSIPAHAAFHTIGSTVSVTFRAGLASLGYAPRLYELSEAVSTVLDTEDALPRWMEGEDIFAEVQTDNSTPPHFAGIIAGLAEAVS